MAPGGRPYRGSGGHRRVDGDGDFEMISAGRHGRRGDGQRGGRGGGRGSGRGSGRGRGIDKHQDSRKGNQRIDPEVAARLAEVLGAKQHRQDQIGQRFRGKRPAPLRGSGKNGGRYKVRGGLIHLAVTGFKGTEAALMEDGGATSVSNFLMKRTGEVIAQHKMEGDALIIAVAPEDADQFTELDNINFVDSKLRIVRVEKLAALEKNAECDTPNTVAVLNEVINGRYNIGQKTLDLSNLGTDQLLNNIKIFDSEARTQKFFPALMKLCETFFGNESERAEAVLKVDMRHNNLEDVRLVQTLADTFPKIKVLDLSDNRFSMKGLELWRSRFKFLEEIVMSGNPLEQESNYMDIITTWYERLQKINGVQVRTVAGAVPDAHTTLPLPILVSSFQDEGFVGENFVKQFFPTYDYDRIACINAYYDAKSTFSLSINTSAPRYPNSRSTKAVGWDSYFKKSRNLIRVTQLPAKISRLYTGAESIRDSWVKFPVTRHPSLSSEQAKWCIECSLIPSLPDPVGQSLSGVSGLVIMVHGEFAEVDLQTDQTTVTRSFDRTFILGPGGGPSGVRVACDTLILRSYGGSEAWKPQVGDYLVVHPPPPELRLPPLVPQGFSSEMPGKSEEQLLKERLAVDLSRATGMTLDSSGECLQTCNWSYEAALVTYEAVKDDLKLEAFWQPGGSLNLSS